jgi:hypothetical protein
VDVDTDDDPVRNGISYLLKPKYTLVACVVASICTRIHKECNNRATNEERLVRNLQGSGTAYRRLTENSPEYLAF